MPCPSIRKPATCIGMASRSGRNTPPRWRRIISIIARRRSMAGQTRSSATSWPRPSWDSEGRNMNFDLTDTQRMLQDTAARLIRERYGFEDRNRILASPEGFSREIWAVFAELGLLGVEVAEEYGGIGGD